MKGSTLPFDVIFSIGLIIILFIGAAIVIHMLVPYLGSNVACIDGQKANIKEINDTIEDVRLTGITQIMKFKVESCVRCMWYDDVSFEIKFKWSGQGTGDQPQTFGVGVPWNFNVGGYEEPDNDKTCGDGGTRQIAGGQWCTFEISSNRIDRVSGCEKLT